MKDIAVRRAREYAQSSKRSNLGIQDVKKKDDTLDLSRDEKNLPKVYFAWTVM